MHKVGVMMMFNMGASPKRVKEIILEVEGKTKMGNIAEYLFDMGKITNLEVELSLEKNGPPVNDSSNITQALKYSSPVNGVLKLYLYEKGEYQNTQGTLLELHSTVKLPSEGSPARSSKPSNKDKSPPISKKPSDKSLKKGQSPQGLKKDGSPKQLAGKAGTTPPPAQQEASEPEVKSGGFCCC